MLPRPSLHALFMGLALSLTSLTSQASGMADAPEVQQFIQDMGQMHGLDQDALQQRFSQLAPNDRVLALIAPPTKPTQRSWQRYRSRFLDQTRIKAGVEFWNENAQLLAEASRRYGVPEEIIVAIIGVETIYGRNTGSFNTMESLATLAFYYPRRADFFRQELEQLLLMARENGNDPADYTGSYAGALGIPQFMPGSLRRFAVDFDGDGRIDLENSVADAIGSVARFLEQHGWQADAPIAVPALLNQAPDPAWIEAGIRPTLEVGALQKAGVWSSKADQARPVTFVDLVTPDAPTEYWLGYENFYVITRYNRSSFYAMSVFQLAEAIKEKKAAQKAASLAPDKG